jgi:hypothetical protein
VLVCDYELNRIMPHKFPNNVPLVVIPFFGNGRSPSVCVVHNEHVDWPNDHEVLACNAIGGR